MKFKLFGISATVIVLTLTMALSAAMHSAHFGKDLMGIHVWRQTETQSVINNFHEEDMNIFNPRRDARGSGEGFHRMEFPLMQWLVAGLYKIFGEHLVISRIFMFITGLFAVFGMYKLIKTLFHSEIQAVMGAWAFNFSPSFYYYTINPMPDNFALCTGIWGLALFFAWIESRRLRTFLFSGILLSIAALTKLPFILYFSIPLIYFLLQFFPHSTFNLQHSTFNLHPSTFNFKSPAPGSKFRFCDILGIMLFALPPLAWYIAVVPGWKDNGIVGGILDNKAPASVLFDNFRHHLLITSTEMLLNYGSVLFFLTGIFFLIKKKAYKSHLFLPLAGLAIALSGFVLFELNMIGKSHDYYFFPFLPLLFILVSYGARVLFVQKPMPVRIFVLLLLIILPVTAYLRINQRWDPEKPGFNKDLLVYKEDLRKAVPDDALCITGNDNSGFIFFYYIDKKGWSFFMNDLNEKKMQQMIREGAQYLYSDSRYIESKKGVSDYLDSLVIERGSVRVFRLKPF